MSTKYIGFFCSLYQCKPPSSQEERPVARAFRGRVALPLPAQQACLQAVQETLERELNKVWKLEMPSYMRRRERRELCNSLGVGRPARASSPTESRVPPSYVTADQLPQDSLDNSCPETLLRPRVVVDSSRVVCSSPDTAGSSGSGSDAGSDNASDDTEDLRDVTPSTLLRQPVQVQCFFHLEMSTIKDERERARATVGSSTPPQAAASAPEATTTSLAASPLEFTVNDLETGQASVYRTAVVPTIVDERVALSPEQDLETHIVRLLMRRRQFAVQHMSVTYAGVGEDGRRRSALPYPLLPSASALAVACAFASLPILVAGRCVPFPGGEKAQPQHGDSPTAPSAVRSSSVIRASTQRCQWGNGRLDGTRSVISMSSLPSHPSRIALDSVADGDVAGSILGSDCSIPASISPHRVSRSGSEVSAESSSLTAMVEADYRDVPNSADVSVTPNRYRDPLFSATPVSSFRRNAVSSTEQRVNTTPTPPADSIHGDARGGVRWSLSQPSALNIGTSAFQSNEKRVGECALSTPKASVVAPGKRPRVETEDPSLVGSPHRISVTPGESKNAAFEVRDSEIRPLHPYRMPVRYARALSSPTSSSPPASSSSRAESRETVSASDVFGGAERDPYANLNYAEQIALDGDNDSNSRNSSDDELAFSRQASARNEVGAPSRLSYTHSFISPSPDDTGDHHVTVSPWGASAHTLSFSPRSYEERASAITKHRAEESQRSRDTTFTEAGKKRAVTSRRPHRSSPILFERDRGVRYDNDVDDDDDSSGIKLSSAPLPSDDTDHNVSVVCKPAEGAARDDISEVNVDSIIITEHELADVSEICEPFVTVSGEDSAAKHLSQRVSGIVTMTQQHLPTYITWSSSDSENEDDQNNGVGLGLV